MTNQQIATRMLEITREVRAARAIIDEASKEMAILEKMLVNSGPDVDIEIERIQVRLKELYIANSDALRWGAALGARHEEIKELERELRRLIATKKRMVP